MSQTSPKLPPLVKLMARDPRVEAVAGALEGGTPRFLGGLWGASAWLVAGLLIRAVGRHAVLVTETWPEAVAALEDLEAFGLAGEAPLLLPPLATVERSDPAFDPEAFSARQVVARELFMHPQARVVVAPVEALFAPMVPRDRFEASMQRVRPGEELDPEVFLRTLVDREFLRVPRVEAPGEVSLRGDVLDVFPWGARNPLRIELFDDEVEEIREFDAHSQRSIARVTMVRFPAARTADFIREGSAAAQAFLDFLPAGSLLFLRDVEALAEKVAGQRGSEHALFGGDTDAVRVRLHSMPLPAGAGIINFRTASVDAPGLTATWPSSLSLADTLANVERLLDKNERVFVFSPSQEERARMSDIVTERLPDVARRVRYATGRLSVGFQLRDAGVAAVSHHEFLARRPEPAAPRARDRERIPSEPIRDFLELEDGDFVVHASHGIGRYRGMERLERHGVTEEFLALEYRDNARLFVPVSKIELVHKYVGAGEDGPKLHRLGSARWKKSRDQVERAVIDLAAELLELQATRERRSGTKFPADDELQDEFEEAFPYEDTPDQVEATRAVKADMESPRPMDRLICGDVGFGKTEVAMRAAFKAVAGGKQVAVMVPTTVLAQQHFKTFGERMRQFPVRVEVLSRFLSPARQKEVVAEAAAGKVDILIGTQRLASDDVDFRDLGLVVLDEEQRFGVQHKKFFQRLRATVDLLTLTATPIPRTLHLSMVRLKDISSLRTAPAGRHGIHTEVLAFDPIFIQGAVRRELDRGGQVYFVHNRVKSINAVAADLGALVPEARIEVVHGQMTPAGIERAMIAFVEHDVDVLVCTTIVESGLDIPSANTIVIHEADRLGLAELHQLRGRVGRFTEQAFAYLIPTPGTSLTQEARSRLKAVEDFSELGAGFRIAMKDLEIRGAGNILGAQQSGHIAAVGYEMYCRLLGAAVKRFSAEADPPQPDVDTNLHVPAHIPPDYVDDPKQKMEVLRLLGGVRTEADRAEVLAELRDRFGEAPTPVIALAELCRLQHGAAELGVEAVTRSREVDGVILRFRTEVLMQNFLSLSGGRAKFLEENTLFARPEPDQIAPERFLAFVLDLLAAAGAHI